MMLYAGNFAACEPWAAKLMYCDKCMVEWTGCWDNFQCPECGEGDLGVFGPCSNTFSDELAQSDRLRLPGVPLD